MNTRKTIRLTERVVKDFVADGKDHTYWDSIVSGFGVRVRPSGSKSFIAYFRIGEGRSGKQKKVTLGACSKMQVEAARKAALSFISKVNLGEDPTAKPKEVEAEEIKEITIAELCAEWLEDDGKRSRIRGKRYGELRDPKNVALCGV